MNSWWNQIKELRANLLRLRNHLRGVRWLVVAVLSASLLMTGFEGIGVGLLVPLLSLLLGGENATPMRPIQWLERTLPNHSPAYYVLVLCAIIIAAIAVKNLASYATQCLAALLKKKVLMNLRNALFRHLQGAELFVFEQRTAGELSNIFLVETARTGGTLDVLVGLLQRISVAAFYLTALFVISWPLTAMALALGVAIGGTISFIYRKLREVGEQLSEANRQMAKMLTQSFAGIRVVRTTHAQEDEIERFEAINEGQARTEERATHSMALLLPLTETLAVIGAMGIIALADIFFVRSGRMLSSHLLGFGFILLRLLPLLNQVYNLQGQLFYLSGGAREVEKWLNLPQHPLRPFGRVPFPGVERAIRFDEVTFEYANATRALNRISFAVPARKTVAMVGPSGSGKSTVAALLLRLRHPTLGRIWVDDEDYWNFSAQTWHDKVAVVEQEAFLFHDTLAANISFGFSKATPEAIDRAIDLAYLREVVDALPLGLKTVVGERGAMLSGGQRQRLAIARALVRDPEILILDEATSALDTISEQQVQLALNKAMFGRTVLVIAHRLTTIRNADLILVLRAGEIIEQGNWEELTSRNGYLKGIIEGDPLLLRRVSPTPRPGC